MEKMNCTYLPEKIKPNIKVRRNPARGTKKQFDDLFVRPRLLATNTRGNNDIELVNYGTDKKQTKVSSIPYMNTRSVTKKLYNIGANHQSPTVKDQIEWREWPIHGMHERPIYHPQVGLAAECLGNDFISWDGFSYQEVMESSKEKKMKTVRQFHRTFTHTRGNKKNQCGSGRNIESSFEHCMHGSLHSVLGYAAQIKKPTYKKLLRNYQSSGKRNELLPSRADLDNNTEIESKLQIVKPQLNLKCVKNYGRLQRVLTCGSKNTLILLKTKNCAMQSVNNYKKNASETSSDTFIPGRVPSEKNARHSMLDEASNTKDSCPVGLNQHTSHTEGSSNIEMNYDTIMMSQPNIQNDYNNDSSEENWLQELISDTAVLYCTAIGTHQDDFVMYLNTLDAYQCIDWIKSGY